MNRRGFLTGLLAASALVRVSSLDLLPRGVVLRRSRGLIIESTPTGHSVFAELYEHQRAINKARAALLADYTKASRFSHLLDATHHRGVDWGGKDRTAIAEVSRDGNALKINFIEVF